MKTYLITEDQLKAIRQALNLLDTFIRDFRIAEATL